MNIRKIKSRGTSLSLCIASLLMLASCGGGGGSASAPAPGAPVSTLSPISASNSTQVASNAYAANGSIGDSSTGVSSLLTGVSVDGKAPGVVNPALALLKRSYAGGAPALLTGVSSSQTQACAGGGTITVSGTAAGSNGPANGDKFSITANNCVEAGTTMNGAISMTFSNISGNLFGTGAGAATMDMTFTDFTVAEGTTSATVAGDMKLVMSQTAAGTVSLAISGTSLQSIERKGGVKVSDFRLSNYTATVSGSGNTFSVSTNYALTGTFGSLGQLSVTVSTLQPFVVGDSGVPSSGSMIINGAASSVTATVVPGNKVRLDYSAKGDGVITQTNTIAWTAFVASL
ncbi:hypothetical protein Q4S45_05875 [Massilia sp. R2A-15]|uniref:hypothetical protein n=1 Tax=Massilia sp. R2A-15 TaxID=3064278 RepID=UPI00273406D8|nr:hypothetical protein [Massilia sp. R2A-15]WLI90646.1 hypothetical protein Q4S45_05875 [Massilia sp. R2A-15]